MMFLKNLFGALLFGVTAIGPAWADQSPLSSPTTGTVSGLALTSNYNGALNALASCNSGASPPANTVSGTPVAGQCWLNTSSPRPTLEIYDGYSWLVQATLDPSGHQWLPVVGGGVASLASNTTTDLGSVAETYLTITGTATITGFGSSVPAGAIKIINAGSTGLTLVHNTLSLILPGGANITMNAGDTAVALSLGGGYWKVLNYQLALNPPELRQVGTNANNIVALDANAKLPAIDGSQLTNLTTSWIKVGTYSLASTGSGSSVIIPNLGNFRTLRITVSRFNSTTDNGTLALTFSTDNGASWIATGYTNYNLTGSGTTTVTFSGSTTGTTSWILSSTGNNKGGQADPSNATFIVTDFNQSIAPVFYSLGVNFHAKVSRVFH